MSARPWLLAAGLIVVWEALVQLLDVPLYLIPAPSAIAGSLWSDRAYLLANTPTTLFETWAGFLLALAIGIGLAIPVALTRFGEEAVMPIIVATQSVPKTALAPVFVVWFGFGFAPKIVMAAALAFFPIVVNLARGLRAVEPEIVQYMTTLGATRRDVFLRLRLPAALPYLFSAMKVAISLSTVGAIVGEFIGASSGLGYVILRAINNYDTAVMFAALLLVSLLGVLSYGVITQLEKRALSWQPESAAASV
ncbi:ABC transporter permease [Pseudonocardia xishanensis]|uniref:ABC transporter permease n=1 Tax=Pseudonocardia xishanensis TaxID=630995 RepID=A0ABP8RE33_9PSEU